MSEPTVYHISRRVTIADLVQVIALLQTNRQLLLEVDPESEGCYPMENWHQIELAVIAGHERRVRGGQ